MTLDLRSVECVIGPVARVSAVANRSRARVYRVQTLAAESFAVKLYPPEHETAALVAELEYARAAAAAGLPHVNHVETAEGAYLVQPNGWYLTTYPWIHGEARVSLDEREWTALVELVAGLHGCTRHVCPASDRWLWDDERHLVARSTIPADVVSHVTSVAGSGERPWSLDERLVVSHNDLLPDNLVWSMGSDRPVPIDLSNIIEAPREWELAVLWAGSCLSTPTHLLTTERVAALLARILDSYLSHHELDVRRAFVLSERALAQRSVFLAWASAERDQIWQRAATAFRVFDTPKRQTYAPAS